MTFIVSPNGVKNTAGTTAIFGSGGSVQMGGNFENTGDVQIDTRANLTVIGNIINSGTFHIKDYVTEEKFRILEKAITEQSGESKELLQQTLMNLQIGNTLEADDKFQKFVSYIQQHPELITASVQIILQLVMH